MKIVLNLVLAGYLSVACYGIGYSVIQLISYFN
jgi:hypothetical protein